MHDDVWTPRRTPAPAPRRVRSAADSGSAAVGRSGLLDASFGELTLFFVKASLAGALALTLTSVVWLALATSAVGLGAGVYLASQSLSAPEASSLAGFDGSSVAAVIATPSHPPVGLEPVIVAPDADVKAASPTAAAPIRVERPARRDPARDSAATDAAIRAEILRMRARRQ